MQVAMVSIDDILATLVVAEREATDTQVEARVVRACQLGLSTLPRRIIGLDISNILGQLAVASLVAFTDGKPDRAHYRRFRVGSSGQWW